MFGGFSQWFWEKLNLPVRTVKLELTEKKVEVASPLQSIINDQVEAMREAGISAIVLPCRGTMR